MHRDVRCVPVVLNLSSIRRATRRSDIAPPSMNNDAAAIRTRRPRCAFDIAPCGPGGRTGLLVDVVGRGVQIPVTNRTSLGGRRTSCREPLLTCGSSCARGALCTLEIPPCGPGRGARLLIDVAGGGV